MKAFDLLNISFLPSERRKDSASTIPADPQQPMCRCPDLVERSALPCADARTASVGALYPVTCRARYYEAASKILEDESGLCTHANADELGHVIQRWLERKYNNWVPR